MEVKRLRLSAEEIAHRLEQPQRTKDGWLACCPAHPDKSPSLSISGFTNVSSQTRSDPEY